jgi:hypothetical protein
MIKSYLYVLMQNEKQPCLKQEARPNQKEAKMELPGKFSTIICLFYDTKVIK